MKKLTNIVAAAAPLAARRSLAEPRTFRAIFPPKFVPVVPVARRGLQCGWMKDAAGRLVCAWSEASLSEDQSIDRRGFGRAGLTLAA